jgi:hypothetical protein
MQYCACTIELANLFMVHSNFWVQKMESTFPSSKCLFNYYYYYYLLFLLFNLI